DIYKVKVANGESTNLTKCGEVHGAWFAGNDIFLSFDTYSTPEEKRGLYRISCADLEKALAGQPAFPHLDSAQLVARIKEKVTAVFGGKKVEDVVLDADSIAKAAQAFADAANSALGAQFDFSENSLTPFNTLLARVMEGRTIDRAVLLGAGAYYGMTLQKNTGIEWKIKPLPFGQWLPG